MNLRKEHRNVMWGGWEGLCFGFWFDLFVCFCLFWWVCLDETSGSTSTVLKIPFHRKQ